MKILIRIIISGALLLCSIILAAQQERTLHFMRLNPYSNFSNPSSFIPYNGYVGIPAISNIKFSFENPSFSYGNVVKRNGDSLSISANDFINTLNKKNNWTHTHVNLEVLGFGFRAKNLFVTFSIRERFEQYLSFPQTLFKLPLQGNMEYLDTPAEFDNLKMNAMAYQEISLGFQAILTKRLYIGIRPKLLFGLGNINTTKTYFKLTTDPDTYNLTLLENFNFNIASVYMPDKDERYIRNAFSNIGFGIDLGATFRINDMMGVSASVNDLGFIRWKSNATNYKSAIENAGRYYQDGAFFFSGIDIAEAINNKEYFDNLVDSLEQYFPVTTEDKHYTTATYAKVSAEFYFQPIQNQRFTAYFRGDIVNNSMYPSFTVAYNGTFFKMIDVCVNYSIIHKSFANLGVGLGFKFGPFHLYMATNNILTPFMPTKARTASFQFGMLFSWGKFAEQSTRKSRDIQTAPPPMPD